MLHNRYQNLRHSFGKKTKKHNWHKNTVALNKCASQYSTVINTVPHNNNNKKTEKSEKSPFISHKHSLYLASYLTKTL